MSEYKKIIPIANQILKKHELCDNCLGRLFSKKLHLSSNKFLGKKLHKNRTPTKKCYICKNLFENLNHFLKIMIDVSSDFSFQTFSVGAIIKPSIVDRDDCIRSQFKLRGIDSIKTDITKELSKSFSKKTKHVVDNRNPEFIFTLNFKDESCQIHSKSITLSGRYIKSMRGISQKQKSCENCSGKGCRFCNFHGISEFDSVEGMISQLIFEKLGGTVAKFTWIGGEDKPSLVLGNGRPFFVKLQNPNKIKMRISAESHIKIQNLKKLKDLIKSPVVVYDVSGKRSEKKISSVKYKKTSQNEFSLFLKADGGLPIKRFVNGDNVSPGVSSIIDNSCKCLEFDFLDIRV